MENKINHEVSIIVKNDKIVECSDDFMKLTQYSKECFINKTIKDLCKILKINTKNKLKTLASENSYYMFTKDCKPIEINIKIKDTKDETTFYFDYDKTSWLDDKFEFIKQIYSNNKTCISIFSYPECILLIGNQRFLNVLGKPFNKKEVSLGRCAYDILPEFSGSSLQNHVMKVLNNGKAIKLNKQEYTTSEENKTYWTLAINPIKLNGELKYIFVTADDITKKIKNKMTIKNQEKIIRQQEKELKAIVENTPTGICVIHKNKKLINLSKNKKHLYDLFKVPNDDKRYSKRQYYNEKNKLISKKAIPISYFYNEKSSSLKKVILKDGDKMTYYSISWTPVKNPNGKFAMGIITSNDITGEVVEMQNLKRIMEMHEDFFSFITHEFKTPITTINSTIQLMQLLYKNEMTENLVKGIKTIKRSTYQEMRLVNNLLDITRAEAGYLKVSNRNYNIIEMTRAIIESILPFAKLKNIDVSFKSSVKEKIISIDDEKYERILLNILSNAIKFTPCNKQINVIFSEDYENVYVKVVDEGPGIPEEKRNLIFDRFGQVGNSYTRKSEGTGIGLYLVKILLNAMGGSIDVQSNEGIGSTFIVEIPNKKLLKQEENKNNAQFMDDHLSKALNIEFSNVYFDK